MDASQAECSQGALNKVWKHFNANRELHQARSGESSQRAATKPFRSVTQHQNTLQDDSTFNQFLFPSQDDSTPLTKPLESIMDLPPPLQVKAHVSWAWEFNSNNTGDASDQQLQDAWYHHSSHVAPVHQLEQAYVQHFTSQQRSSDMNHVMDDQWETQFAAISIDPPSLLREPLPPMQKQVEPFIPQQPLSTPSASSEASFAQEIPNTTTTSISDEDFDDWIDESDLPTKSRHNTLYDPDLGEYTFAPLNPYLEKKDAINVDTPSEAILVLEAAILQDHVIDSNHAWMQLALQHAQNGNHTSAVQALKKTRHDPDRMLQLALCYSSLELYPAAYYALEQWISQAYPDLMSKDRQLPNEPFMLHQRVLNSFLAAARSKPETNAMDPDVQVGLAILSAGSGEYHKAADCFRAVLHMNPKQVELWNRLGVTLANDGKPEEAIDAYSHSLELDPSCVSARHHLSLSCITIGCYKEAIEHVLTAIALYSHQPSKDDQTAMSLWDTLGKALKMMGMHDLARQAKVGSDVKKFQRILE